MYLPRKIQHGLPIYNICSNCKFCDLKCENLLFSELNEEMRIFFVNIISFNECGHYINCYDS